ncbi:MULTISPECIES: hypothetical protein [unclassified Actinopolyspora]|uniref:hypothetical protein n=1 Tax=unclassified Actinopolyspora TaxID=2639451 RepID=UPI0013F5F4B4|nr:MULTISPECIES: hypothetical protein [unclassified Actinopolyspora]NHD18609.1 hypothetical protein [Actinopolyspora sp. BKK2]NHE78069.1 hypothetical protein [Actinopolyspora sp. BKK1]
MPTRPISRYFNHGLTFRWAQGDREIAVKRGYVVEGNPFIEVTRPKHFSIADRPSEDPAQDRDTWLATIPANPSDWDKPGALARLAENWAAANPRSLPADNRGEGGAPTGQRR